MSWTFAACVLISFAWIGLSFLWGKAFLSLIHAERGVASSVAFGYLIIQVLYQIIYLPFYLTRGSYRTVSYIWISIVAIVSFLLIIYLRKHSRKEKKGLTFKEKFGVCISAIIVLGLAIYISLHVPFYGADTRTYISTMNNAYYRDSIWIDSGVLLIHNGLCSIFHLFTTSSLLSGIKPYYISLYTVRIIGVVLFSMIMYRTGVIVFRNKEETICWPAVFLGVLAPYLLMFWGSNYTAEFFYWRINEAKGFCQFVLLPLGFSVFLSMLKDGAERKILWKEQLLVGMAAIPVSSSSMTSYLFLLLLGVAALLAFDRLKNGLQTIGGAVACATPNLIYLLLYILVQKQIIAF